MHGLQTIKQMNRLLDYWALLPVLRLVTIVLLLLLILWFLAVQ